jgi:hypothetical protein
MLKPGPSKDQGPCTGPAIGIRVTSRRPGRLYRCHILWEGTPIKQTPYGLNLAGERFVWCPYGRDMQPWPHSGLSPCAWHARFESQGPRARTVDFPHLRLHWRETRRGIVEGSRYRAEPSSFGAGGVPIPGFVTSSPSSVPIIHYETAAGDWPTEPVRSRVR